MLGNRPPATAVQRRHVKGAHQKHPSPVGVNAVRQTSTASRKALVSPASTVRFLAATPTAVRPDTAVAGTGVAHQTRHALTEHALRVLLVSLCAVTLAAIHRPNFAPVITVARTDRQPAVRVVALLVNSASMDNAPSVRPRRLCHVLSVATRFASSRIQHVAFLIQCADLTYLVCQERVADRTQQRDSSPAVLR